MRIPHSTEFNIQQGGVSLIHSPDSPFDTHSIKSVSERIVHGLNSYI